MLDILGDIVGSFIQADAVGDASDAQQAGLAADRELKNKWLTTQWNAAAPARTMQNSIIQQLMQELGLSPAAIGSGPSATPGPQQTYEGLRQQLLPNYTAPGRYDVPYEGASGQYLPGRVDEEALEAAIQARLSVQGQQNALGAPPGITVDPRAANFGALSRNFTGADLENEPGYQFGLKQGVNALQGGAAARGGLYSGAAMKALQRYGQDYAGTKYGEAFNRDAANKDRRVNYLLGASGQSAPISSQANSNALSLVGGLGQNALASGDVAAASGLARGSVWGNLATKLGSRQWGGGSPFGGGAFDDNDYTLDGYGRRGGV